MGFYPVNPASGVYAIGTPLLKKSVIKLSANKQFIVSAPNSSAQNIYIQSAKLNGKPYNHSYILQSDIINGGTLEFVMGDKLNTNWGVIRAIFKFCCVYVRDDGYAFAQWARAKEYFLRYYKTLRP